MELPLNQNVTPPKRYLSSDVKNFQLVLDFGFTAKVESDFDKIAEGKAAWTKVCILQ